MYKSRSMSLTVRWQGRRYIDFVRAWPVHAPLDKVSQISKDKKGVPGILHKLRIPRSAVITTKKGCFHTVLSEDDQAHRSYWITTKNWKDLIGPVPDGVHDPDVPEPVDTEAGMGEEDVASGQDTGDGGSCENQGGVPFGCSTGGSAGSDNVEPEQDEPEPEPSSPLLHLSVIDLDDEEKFTFGDHPIDIRAYGERTPVGLYVNALDVKNAIGIRYHPLPDSVQTVRAILPDGKTVDVISFEEQLGLMRDYKKKSKVACHIWDWVVSLVLAAKHGEPEVREGIAKAFKTQFSVVRGDRRRNDHPLPKGGHCNYLIDVCSLQFLMGIFPDIALALLPPGADPRNYVVVKYGTGNEDRSTTVVRELRKLIPGCDPIIVHIIWFPGASKEEAEGYETGWKTDFHQYNIHGVFKKDKRAYTELFAVDAEATTRGIRRMDETLERHNSKRFESQRIELAGLEQARTESRMATFKADTFEKQLAASTSEKDARIAETDARIAETDARITEKDARIAEKDARIKALESDVGALKTTLKKTLSSKLSSKFEALLKVCG